MAENAILIGVFCGEYLVAAGVFSEPLCHVLHYLGEAPRL